MRLTVATAAALLVITLVASVAQSSTGDPVILGQLNDAGGNTTKLIGDLDVHGALSVKRALALRQSQIFVVPAGHKQGSVPMPAMGSASQFFAVATLQQRRMDLWVKAAVPNVQTNSVTVYLNRPTTRPTTVAVALFAEGSS